MRSFAVLFVPLVLGSGCKKSYYIEMLDGDWSGLASAGAVTLPTTASFTWDGDKEHLDGTVDFDAYAYYVDAASSDKESAELKLVPTNGQGPGEVTALEFNEEGNKFDSKFKINTCPNGEGDPAACEVTGTLAMTIVGGGGG